jgi:cation diffusion facilitator CzcD-associated flavoprotein CzcO
VTHHRTVIVGTGFSGLGMAIRLMKDGDRDFVLLERAHDIGGTWRDNTYPGCRCDVPSHLYSFSFAPNPNWSNTFSPQPEILDYLRDVARRFGVLPHIRFDTELQDAEWDEDAAVWRIETSAGPLTADVLVLGPGPLSDPLVPELPGLESFEGTSFHSAQWDHDHDLDGERVAVIGTGASAIQFVPEIQPRVGKLHVFQRTPPWVVPHPNREMSPLERAIYRRLPLAQLGMRAGIYWARETFVVGFRRRRVGKVMERMALRHLEEQVSDPELRAKLRPSYAMGCKRILPTDEWYPTLTKPNVEVVSDAITEVRPRSIVTADGAEREVDVIVLGTGFRVTDVPAAEYLCNGDGVSLADVWEGSPQAYRGTTVAGFPNLFILVGPNTGLGHNSILFMIESQVAYVLDCLRVMDEQGLASVEVREDAQAAFNAGMQKQMRGSVWTEGGCASWYLDAQGRNTTLWPGYTWRFRRLTRQFDPAAYLLRPRVTERDRIAVETGI